LITVYEPRLTVLQAIFQLKPTRSKLVSKSIANTAKVGVQTGLQNVPQFQNPTSLAYTRNRLFISVY